MTRTAALMARELCCGYGKAPVVGPLSLTLNPGQALAIVGPNGAGKTTLLRTLAGLLPAHSGEVAIAGEALATVSPERRAQLAALLPQTGDLPPGLTVRDYVTLGRTPHLGLFGRMKREDEQAVARALADCALDALAARPMDQVSGGEQQRARIALTLAQQTPVVLLDEPVNHLDLGRRYQFYALLARLRRERQLAVVLVLHDLAEVFRETDHVVLVSDGAATSLDANCTQARLRLAKAFDLPVDRIPELCQEDR